MEKNKTGDDYDINDGDFKSKFSLNKKKILQNHQADRWKKKIPEFFLKKKKTKI